jgi:hypothetical protein
VISLWNTPPPESATQHLRDQIRDVGAQPAPDLPVRRALEWLDVLTETWQTTDLIEEKSDVIHDVYAPRRAAVRQRSP